MYFWYPSCALQYKYPHLKALHRSINNTIQAMSNQVIRPKEYKLKQTKNKQIKLQTFTSNIYRSVIAQNKKYTKQKENLKKHDALVFLSMLKEIYIYLICNIIVKVKPLIQNRGITQCARCQCYNHTIATIYQHMSNLQNPSF